MKHQSSYKINHATSRAWIVGERTVFSFIIFVSILFNSGLFLHLFSETSDVALTASLPAVNQEAVETPLLTTLQNPNPIEAKGGAEIVVNENVLISTGPVGADEIAEQKGEMGEIRVYTVREGDTLSQIAEMFDVTTNTVLWANDIKKASSIHPGDTLVILPIAGVQHIVKSGETISSIAKKYEGEAEEILSYNQLSSAEELSVGDTLIIPGGALHTTVYVAATPVNTSGGPASYSNWLSHPAPGSIKTQGLHGYNAVDLANSYGSPIRAAAAGEVIVSKNSGWNGGYGQYIVIRHPNGVQTLYAHLSSNAVGVGAYVSQGEVIGGMGSTGKSTGTHLHFEVRGATNPF